MGQPNEDPPADGDATELAALRKEKAEREAAERKAADDEAAAMRAELAALRKDKTDREAAEAKRVKTPTKKADKPAPPADDAPPERKRSRVSRSWFGDAADD